MSTDSQHGPGRHVLFQEFFGLSLTQAEVDFVIPDLAVDRPLCIDPFLLYKSKDATLRDLHVQLLDLFHCGVALYDAGQHGDLDILIDFPEVNEIGFGYTERRVQGSGLGQRLNRVLADILGASAALRERGIRHIEELQLLSPGIGPDRISDIAANVLKRFLVSYTQRQAALWNIPLTKGLPLHHSFDFDTWEWEDGYFDLPLNPVSGLPILLVPRRIVRQLPWINYDDYIRTDFKLYLRPARPKGNRQRRTTPPARQEPRLTKGEITGLTRQRLDVLDSYIRRKEQEAQDARPSLSRDQPSANIEYQRGEEFIARMAALPRGVLHAAEYQHLVLEILNYLFEPDLSDGELEVKTHLGTERRDIIFVNEADASFWEYVRSRYGGFLVMFEIKNTQAVALDHVNQAAAYLGARLGMLGFIVSRSAAGANIVQKTYAIYNDTPGIPRKVVLVVSDQDLVEMIRLKQADKAPVRHIQGMYRKFIQSVQ